MRSLGVLPCRVQLSTARLCPCVPLWTRIVANNNRKLRGSAHQLEQYAQRLIKLTVFRCTESVMLPYSVLMNGTARGFYSFRKFREIEFEDSSVIQLLPCGVGHSGLLAGVTRKRGVPGYCASARITLAQRAIRWCVRFPYRKGK